MAANITFTEQQAEHWSRCISSQEMRPYHHQIHPPIFHEVRLACCSPSRMVDRYGDGFLFEPERRTVSCEVFRERPCRRCGGSVFVDGLDPFGGHECWRCGKVYYGFEHVRRELVDFDSEGRRLKGHDDGKADF